MGDMHASRLSAPCAPMAPTSGCVSCGSSICSAGCAATDSACLKSLMRRAVVPRWCRHAQATACCFTCTRVCAYMWRCSGTPEGEAAWLLIVYSGTCFGVSVEWVAAHHLQEPWVCLCMCGQCSRAPLMVLANTIVPQQTLGRPPGSTYLCM